MAIYTTNFSFPHQTKIYHGKVRDVYTIDDKYLVMIATDRLSAFDVVLPKPIPYKGQVLNQMASLFLEQTKHIVPNWMMASPDANVTIGKRCEPLKVEMVIRGYLSGHAAREYKLGKRMLCGVAMPDGMKESDKFPEPIITPSTKADAGHDEDINREEIIAQQIVSEKDYLLMEDYTRKLFSFGQNAAAEKGLILVDTKYEFGKFGDEIILMDEIHTPDSSRYFYADGYEENQKNNVAQKQLSKEFVRQWLIEHNFMGKENQTIPDMPDSFIDTITARYIELYEKITGKVFVKYESNDVMKRIEKNVFGFLSVKM